MEKKEAEAAEKARTEETLREWRELVESLDDIVILIDKDFNIEKINDSGLKLIGEPAEQIVGRKCYEVLHNGDNPVADCPLEKSLKTKKVESIDRFEKDFGKYLSIKCSPIFDENGEIIKFVDVMRDITERKRAEEALRSSHDYLEKLTNSMWDAVFSVKMPERVIEWANDSFRLIGYEPEDCIGKTTQFLYPDEEGFLTFGNKLKSAITAGKDVLHTEQLLRRKNGEVFTAEVTVTFFREKGEVVRVTSIVRDITERKQMEQQLRQYSEQLEQMVSERTAELEESEAVIETMFNAIADPILVVRPDRVIIAVNKAMTELLGYREDELIGHNYIDTIIPPEERHLSEKTIGEVISKGVTLAYERIWQTKDGVEIPVALHTAPLRDGKGAIIGIIVAARDMREIKSLIDELEQSRAYIESIFNAAADPITVVGKDLNYVAINKAMAELLGYREDELIGCRSSKILVPRERHLSGELSKEVMTKGITVEYERTLLTKDGVEIPALRRAAPLRDAKGEIIGAVGILRDLRKEKALIAELARSEERYRAIFEHAPVAITVADSSNTIQLWNEQAEKQTGYKAEEVIGKSRRAGIPNDLLKEAKWLMEQVVENGYVKGYETERVTKDGVRFPVELTMAALRDDEGNFRGTMIIVTDLSERKRLEQERAEAQERLLWAERLAAIGQVASGMAHELRQPLSVINNAAYFLKMKLDADDEKVKRHLDILEKEVAICESIISDVLDFVRPKKPVRKQVDINLVIEEALSQATLPPGIAVVTEFKELPPLTGDPNQLERVFTNIILNAAQAMPDGGRLVIRTETDNDLIRAEIEDSGSGIPEEDLRRVFEPLFTRRAAGTGLGLPLAKSIIEVHHGTIDIESEVDHGTRVAVELPLRGRRGR